MLTKQYQNLPELKEKTVNNGIRICVNCGSVTIHVENCGVFCKDCSSFFNVVEKNNKKTYEEVVKKMTEYMKLIEESRLEEKKNG